MVTTLLDMAVQPQDFQFTRHGSAQKVQLAMTLIQQKGYRYALEMDIKDFFPTFCTEDLIAALPLPTEAVRQIIMAECAQWVSPTSPSLYIPTPPGLPQGSASSSAVARWCVAQMKLAELKSATLINHADNFFIFATTKAALEKASKALQVGIADLPGGHFNVITKQSGKIEDGFAMLGCWIAVEDGSLSVWPSDKNLETIGGKSELLEQEIFHQLVAADKTKSATMRMEGLNNFLRLQNMVDGWIAAFSFCGDQTTVIEDDLSAIPNRLRRMFSITDDELGPLKDPSTLTKFDWYSGQ